ncbi:hypothetical protein TraAM80_02197 [Trypanosoma rangeli]|uniref:PX domain-containing protein n=1 Tax=Trypanosoma rangeli TaxID=5698 RepID=A0A3R7MPZ5_TRYRA|nr:uncharacterized protein TraAM80_02197 [Trypanosoma rangeli]RNF09400.1 hypothetical protein TraAM80_02197 [Trypanosoma rangeli]|eukprot:RNF09400.1 hypothetical protein TraAM80_02197 [Trypanosoma rangeli]
MEFLVADAERMYTENGRLQHLSHWSYKILARSFLASYQNFPLLPSNHAAQNFTRGAGYIDFCTWHRYSDFEWLATQMELEFPGVLFPPIPPKETDGTMDKFTELLSNPKENGASTENPLVKKRMRQLQLALNAISCLHELHESPLLKAFATFDELAWRMFRDERQKQYKKSFFSTVKSKGLNLISKLRSIGEPSDHDDVAESPLAVIETRQSDLADLLHTCFAQVEHITKYCVSELRQWSDVNELRKSMQGSPLPWTACYCGHLVQHAQHPEMEGVVRSVNDDNAVVEWDGQNGELTTVRLEELNYPSSGISDPAIFALQELTAQIESYCMYVSRSAGVTTLTEVEDMLWFLSSYATRCVHVIKRFKELSAEVQSLTRATEKKPSADKFERLEQVKQKLSKGTARFTDEYNGFYRVLLRNSLLEVSRKFGKVMTVIMSDEEWDKRLSVANAMLTPAFSLPPEDVRGVSAANAKKSSSTPGNFVKVVGG